MTGPAGDPPPEPIGDPPPEPPIPAERTARIRCVHCDTVGAVRTEWRGKLIPKPLGTWSLSGGQMKTVAHFLWWPWMVCRAELGGCGWGSEGKRGDGT